MSSEGRQRTLFFLLSGEHPTLPHAELRAILEAEGFSYKLLEELCQLSRLKCDPACAPRVAARAAMTRACCLELFSCQAEREEILRHARDAPFWELLRPGQSFRVRVKRVRAYSRDINTVKLEGELGAVAYGAVEGLKVDLRHPQVEFLGVLTEGRFFFGLKLSEVDKHGFVERRPSKKPFFHPTGMMPKLARCMVNLARARPGELVLDPFCGTGSILVEAALIGCRVMGADISARMAFGCLLNMRFLGLEPEGILVADAFRPPARQADRIVTDPPYGRSASTAGLDVKQVFERFLALLPELLPKGHVACVSGPSRLSLSEMGAKAGLEPVEAHFFFVHGDLTRELAVLKVP